MNKLFAVLISSALLVTAGQALAQASTGDGTSNPGSSMSKDPSSDQGMSKKSKKHNKHMHKKSKSNAESDTTKSMGTGTDSSMQNKKNP